VLRSEDVKEPRGQLRNRRRLVRRENALTPTLWLIVLILVVIVFVIR